MGRDDFGLINRDMDKLGKEMDRDRDEAGTDGYSLASAEANAHRLASQIDGVREQSEGIGADQRAVIDSDKAEAGGERDKDKKL